jgi:hypothetical protein
MSIRHAHLWVGFVAASALATALALGCGDDTTATTGGDAGGGDDAPATDAPQGTDAPTDTGGGMQSVTFAYHPQWPGATSVEVVGGFGQASDWSTTSSFLTLTNDGTGTYSGSAMLAAGQYLYVFRITGDAAAAMPAKSMRYAVDPAAPGFAPCPAQSPTFNKIDANPCSTITAPQGGASATYHVRGVVKTDGAAANGYLVVLERNEKSSHHFFANRATVGTDGAFDLVATTGSWRLQILHPTLLAKNDLDRDPLTLQALRRTISSDIALASDVTVETPDMAFHDYGSFSPTSDAGQTLPTAFTFGTTSQRLDVYAGPKEIGDPWFSGALTTTGTDLFDGGFNTKQAQEAGVSPATPYFWGTEIPALPEAGVKWTNQTMVFPITWQ